jgi:hypothetical protein
MEAGRSEASRTGSDIGEGVNLLSVCSESHLSQRVQYIRIPMSYRLTGTRFGDVFVNNK